MMMMIKGGWCTAPVLLALIVVTLVRSAYGKRPDFRPVNLDNLPAVPNSPPAAKPGPPGRVGHEDFPPLGSPNMPPRSEEFPALGPPDASNLHAQINARSGSGRNEAPTLPNSPAPPERPFPGYEFSPLNPVGPSWNGQGPPRTIGTHSVLPGPSSWHRGPPAGHYASPTDGFPPLTPGSSPERDFRPSRPQSPARHGSSNNSEGRHFSRTPSRSSSPERVPALGSRDSSPGSDTPYSHLTLVIQWGGGVCASGYSSNRPCLRESLRDHWTIHGLWPSSEQASPEFCTAENFDGRRLESLKRSLNENWPSFTSTQDRYFTFWRHEWQKHGTCATDVPQLRGMVAFFNTTLNLFNKHNIKRYLENSNIFPSNQTTYQPADIVKAISDDYSYKFDIVCTQSQSLNQPVLSEIRFCFDRHLQPRNCRGRHIRCGNRLYHLPLNRQLNGSPPRI